MGGEGGELCICWLTFWICLKPVTSVYISWEQEERCPLLLHCGVLLFLFLFFACNTFMFYTLTCMFLFCPLKSKTKPYFPSANQNLGNETDVDWLVELLNIATPPRMSLFWVIFNNILVLLRAVTAQLCGLWLCKLKVICKNTLQWLRYTKLLQCGHAGT